MLDGARGKEGHVYGPKNAGLCGGGALSWACTDGRKRRLTGGENGAGSRFDKISP